MAEGNVEPELPRGIALAWGVAADPQRGPKREMSVERIVEAAVDLADREGLGAVSMAAVAARLGYTPMSLYRYVTAKDDLVLLMQDEATGLPSDAARQGTWRAQLEALYAEQVQMYLQHPWLVDVPISGSPATPNSAAWMDAGLHALADSPLSHADRLSVLLLITGHARWAGIVMAGYARATKERGLDSDEIGRREDRIYRTLITAEAYPALRQAIEAGAFLDDSDPFSFGVARSLDGVEAYIDSVQKGRPDALRPWPEADDHDIADDKRYREARKAVRDAEKALRDARKVQREAARDARDRLGRRGADR